MEVDAPESQTEMREKLHLEKKGVHLFLDAEGPNWISTNRLGAEVIEDSMHSSPEEIALKISNEKGVSFEAVLEDCKGFLEEMKRNDFQQAEHRKYPGRSRLVECGQLQELWIYTNNSCNLRCRHCFVSAGESSKGELGTDEITAIIDEAESLGAFRFYFTGGEPFLREDIFELIDYVLEGGKNQLIILSNGTLFKGERLQQLKKLRRKNLTIQISLEAPEAEINDAMRGDGSFEKTADGIKNLVSIGITPIVTTTITNHNVEHLTGMPAFISSLGVKNLHILWLQNSGRAKSAGQLSARPENVTETMRDLMKESKRHGVVLDNEMSLKLRTMSKRGRKQDLCNSCFEMLSIDSDGQVYPCAPLNGTDGFSCGSIKKSSLKEIWLNSEQAKKIRENSVSLKEGCQSCEFRFICGGGCFCQSYFSTAADGAGDIRAMDPYCSTNRALIYDLLWESAIPPGHKENGYEEPQIIASMDPRLASCSVPSTRVADFSFEVGMSHCSCVLAVDLEGDKKIVKGDSHRLVNNACFNERAQEYDKWLESPIGSTYDRLAKDAVFSLIDIKEGNLILDLGCGTGNYALALTEKCGRVVAVDASEWMLRLGMRNAKKKGAAIDFKHDYMEDLTFPSDFFDSIVCMNVLEFSSDPEKALSEAFRVLKKNGQLILGVLNKKSMWGATQTLKKNFAKGAYYEARFFGVEEICGLLRNHVKEVTTTIYFPPLNQKVMLKFANMLDRVGREVIPENGALIVLKAVK